MMTLRFEHSTLCIRAEQRNHSTMAALFFHQYVWKYALVKTISLNFQFIQFVCVVKEKQQLKAAVIKQRLFHVH